MFFFKFCNASNINFGKQMPFLTKDELKAKSQTSSFIDSVADGTHFDTIEKDAGLIITSITGVEPPDDAADAPDGLKYPAAMIIIYIAMMGSENPNPDSSKDAALRYREAKELLKHYKTTGDDGVGSMVGQIEGLYE